MDSGWASPDGRLVLAADVLALYRAVLAGERTLPSGFWTAEPLRPAACLRYGFEAVIGAGDRAGVLAAATMATLDRLRLGGYLRVHGGRIYDLLTDAYPEYDLLPWELPTVPKGLWDQQSVREAAVRWWLGKAGYTPAQALRLLDERHAGLHTSLAAHGLSTLRQGLRDLLVALGAPPDNQAAARRAQVRARRSLPCPYCDQPYTAVWLHIRRAHPGRPVIGFRVNESLSAEFRANALRRRVLPPDRIIRIRKGLSIPADRWPADGRQARVIADTPGEVRLVPARMRRPGTRRLDRNGQRWEWRVPAALWRRVQPMDLRFEGAQVVATFTEDDWMEIQYWLKGQRRRMSDLRILPSRKEIMLAVSLWPGDAVAAGLAVDRQGALLIYAVTDAGTLVLPGVPHRGRPAQSPISLESCYSVRRLGKRMMIGAPAFLQAHNLPTGDWRWLGPHPTERALAFAPIASGNDTRRSSDDDEEL